MKSVALIGMPGTMKSTIGNMLTKLLKREYIDTDDIFEKEENNSIAEVFKTKGEAYFRERETEILKRECQKEDRIISCGGGVVLRSENVETLKNNCIVVLLTATPEKIYERTSGNSKRPLLAGGGLERIKTMYSERKDLYKAAAEFTIDTTALHPMAAARRIKKYLSNLK